MNVLYLLSSNSFSGAENVVCTIITNLHKNYNAYYCSPNGPIKNSLESRNIKFVPIKYNIFSLRKICKKYNIDVIHANDLKASFLSYFAPKKVKIISHLHAGYPFFKKVNLWTLIYKFIQKRFFKIIVVSDGILDTFVFKKIIMNKTIVLRNVIDSNMIIKRSKEEKTPLYDIIFVGRIIDIKNPLLFLEIVKDLKAKNKKIKAAMIGKGDLFNKCKEYIIENSLENNVDMLGFVENPYSYMKNSKLLLMPSKYEGLPMTALEALILGVPVVNSGVNGFANLFKNNKELICSSKKQYIHIINLILNNKYKCNTKKIVEEYINMEKYINSIEELYEK